MPDQPSLWSTVFIKAPLVLLRDTERSLRAQLLRGLVPLLPVSLAIRLGEISLLADTTLMELATIDLDTITEAERQSARIQIGLLFVGSSALSLLFLLLFLSIRHPHLSPLQQVSRYWHPYIYLVGIGVAGMFMLGREALRPPGAIVRSIESGHEGVFPKKQPR